MRVFVPVIAFCSALALSGCSSGTTAGLPELVKGVGSGLFKSRAEVEAELAAQNAAVVADPEALRTFQSPILLIAVPKLNALAVIGPLTERGDESVWYTADGNSLTFRDGLIVATRGLEQDLQSADVPDIRTVRGEAVRDHFYRDGDEVIRRRRFFCDINGQGSADAEVLGRSYPTTLVTETCKSDTEGFENAYWIGAAGELRMSRQWVSGQVGHIVVQKVQE